MYLWSWRDCAFTNNNYASFCLSLPPLAPGIFSNVLKKGMNDDDENARRRSPLSLRESQSPATLPYVFHCIIRIVMKTEGNLPRCLVIRVQWQSFIGGRGKEAIFGLLLCSRVSRLLHIRFLSSDRNVFLCDWSVLCIISITLDFYCAPWCILLNMRDKCYICDYST